jgi:hypothetical protein
MLTKLRDAIRLNSVVAKGQYLLGNQYCRFAGRLIHLPIGEAPSSQEVAVCLRFRDEARYLKEWIEYYSAAGISHFFLYNNNSADDYLGVLAPFIKQGLVTLIEWPRVPASPAAEEDCIRRAVNRFSWVGFLDADEFVVIKDGQSIPSFLSGFGTFPGVALHWIYFGSNGHKERPKEPVIEAYTRRRKAVNIHVKVFVRPEAVSQCFNSHSWFFRHGKTAVDEDGFAVMGSRSMRANANRAWINHYYSKSEEDYIERTRQKNTLDRSGMAAPSRTSERMLHHLTDNNEAECLCAVEYYKARLAALEQR